MVQHVKILLRNYAALCRAAWAVALADQSLEAEVQELRACLQSLEKTCACYPPGSAGALCTGHCAKGSTMPCADNLREHHDEP